MPLPNIQQSAQYGDSASLQKLGAVRRQNNPAAGVNPMKQMAGGRPAVVDPVELAIKNAPQAAQQLQEDEQTRYSRMFGTLGTEYETAMKWIRIASQPGAGPFTKAYAMAALDAFKRSFYESRKQTPFFDNV